MFRSDMRPCKACDETSASSDSDIPGICIHKREMCCIQHRPLRAEDAESVVRSDSISC